SRGRRATGRRSRAGRCRATRSRTCSRRSRCSPSVTTVSRSITTTTSRRARGRATRRAAPPIRAPTSGSSRPEPSIRGEAPPMDITTFSSPRRELDRLREEVRETSERLQETEDDNERLRERMAFRHRELDELRRQLAESAPTAEETEELRHRLSTAENAAAALARELERVEKELDVTRNRFHMEMLSEALREFDNDAVEISDDEDELDHAVIIRDGYTFTFAPA